MLALHIQYAGDLQMAQEAMKTLDIPHHAQGTYIAIEGPQFLQWRNLCCTKKKVVT